MFEQIFNRYVRHTLTFASGYLVSKGIVDGEVAGITVDVLSNFLLASITGGFAIFASKVSDKLLKR